MSSELTNPSKPSTSRVPVYLGMFLISFATLAFEVTLTRLMSVITWYYQAFFSVSTAMLGMTVGAVYIYLRPHLFFRDQLYSSITKASLGCAFATLAALIVLCSSPFYAFESFMGRIIMLMAISASALPFFFSGICVTAVLTKCDMPVGKLYASDLAGAAAGCLFVLGCLEIMDAPSLIILCGALACLATLSFGRLLPHSMLRLAAIISFICLVALVLANRSTFYGIRPFIIKGHIEQPADYALEEWNSFSRVVVFKERLGSFDYWGPSPLAPQDQAYSYQITIDGMAGTSFNRFSEEKDIEQLRYDVTNLAYYLRPDKNVVVIGLGGGRDVQSAVLFGAQEVVGVDVNPTFPRLLQGDFGRYAGLAGRDNVTLVADEARSYLSKNSEQYSVIQMSLIDTWASTGAGAFALSENSLYTVEAWQIFYHRLAPDGIFTVSRWYTPGHLGEAGRIVSLASGTLISLGVADPSEHIIMATSGQICTLLVSQQPFSEQDLATIKKVAGELQYELVLMPGQVSLDPGLQQIVSARSRQELTAAIADKRLNYEPPTDENPYFFNMLRLQYLNAANNRQGGVTMGNLQATVALINLIISLFLMTIVTIILPLLIKRIAAKKEGRQPDKVLWPAALYFVLIGAGFMLVEIALIQRLSVFLSHPTYALGILLFTIIASSGLGSYLSEYLPLSRKPWVYIYPAVMALAILLVNFIMRALISSLITAPMYVRILVSLLTLFPMGCLMGMFFPTGMRIVKELRADETPWYWAMNGIIGVLCSTLAVFISIYFGISQNMYLAAACYAAVLLCIYCLQATIRRQGSLPVQVG